MFKVQKPQLMSEKPLLYAFFYTESSSLLCEAKVSPQLAQSQTQVSPRAYKPGRRAAAAAGSPVCVCCRPGNAAWLPYRLARPRKC